jgi:mannose-6-phosphate isomerase-like protein (cupin superfamily)
MPELINHCVTGFLCSSVDEMIEAVKEVKNLDRTQCRKWVEERFSADRMVEDYLKVYEKILNERKREDHRPWGFYEVLSDKDDHKVKRITVYPGKRLSYQRHFRRAEHWYVVHGEALVTLDGKDYVLKSGNAVDIPVGSWHRIKNSGQENLVFIEVQTGDYFGEDDIERAEDDYGRV